MSQPLSEHNLRALRDSVGRHLVIHLTDGRTLTGYFDGDDFDEDGDHILVMLGPDGRDGYEQLVPVEDVVSWSSVPPVITEDEGQDGRP